MNITTLITGIPAVSLGVSSTVLDDDGNVKNDAKGAGKGLLATATATTATAIAGSAINNLTQQQIRERYASSYVESLSDEELERALEEANLLSIDTDDNTLHHAQ